MGRSDLKDDIKNGQKNFELKTINERFKYFHQ